MWVRGGIEYGYYRIIPVDKKLEKKTIERQTNSFGVAAAFQTEVQSEVFNPFKTRIFTSSKPITAIF